MSYMDLVEKAKSLYCTPSHITKSLLKREYFPGSIWESAAGRGDVVKALWECGYHNVRASDIADWGFHPCEIKDFLLSTRLSDSLVTNPPFDKKDEFLAQAKRLVRHKIALLLPIRYEYTAKFLDKHECDREFPWKALYVFAQPIHWSNARNAGGKMTFGWFVFERGYRGVVLREKIRYRRNTVRLVGSVLSDQQRSASVTDTQGNVVWEEV